MTDEDVQVIESELRIVVPEFLRRWLMENPFRDLPDEARCLVYHRDQLIHQNIELRRAGYYGRKWPDRLLWIGDDRGGGAYFVDVTENPAAVYWYDWEEGEGDTVLPESAERHAPEKFIRYISEISD